MPTTSPRTRRSGLIALACLVTAIALSALSAKAADAHQDGCHRWHSCPSDTGSYVCGDLGYTSGCPGGSPTTTPATPTVSAPAASGPADGANFIIGQGSGVTFTVDSPGGSPSTTLSRGNALGTYGLLTGSAYPVVLLPT